MTCALTVSEFQSLMTNERPLGASGRPAGERSANKPEATSSSPAFAPNWLPACVRDKQRADTWRRSDTWPTIEPSSELPVYIFDAHE